MSKAYRGSRNGFAGPEPTAHALRSRLTSDLEVRHLARRTMHQCVGENICVVVDEVLFSLQVIRKEIQGWLGRNGDFSGLS